MDTRLRVLLILLSSLVAGAHGADAKQCSRFVTAQMRANAVANAGKLEWAATEQRNAVAAADRWASMTDEQLWAIVPSQELPRDIHVSQAIGCPNCGKAIDKFGNYPWTVDFWNRPWTIQCPNCKSIYPKNDFYAFYKTALDEHGMFRHELGDRSLLFNADHPDPKAPLHKVYVDDGYGMFDEKGNKFVAIAYYVWLGQWQAVRSAIGALSRAYTLTDDRKYAYKTAVLLDRLADVYPEMDLDNLAKVGFPRSYAGPPYLGRIEDHGWENDVVWLVAHAYDYVFEGIQGDQELVDFCARQSQKYKLADKSSIAVICKHIEDNLLVDMLKSYKDDRISGNTARIRNPAAAAIALDRGPETEQWLDYVFSPGFPNERYGGGTGNSIPWMLIEGVDRHGMGNMSAGYGRFVSSTMRDLADVLCAYPDYRKHDVVADFPKLKQCFLIDARLNCLDAAVPNIGDAGATGGWYRGGNVTQFVRGYRYYRDPRMAALAAHFAEGDAGKYRLPEDIYEADPEALAGGIAAAVKDEPFRLHCEHLGRYGQAVLQTETPQEGRALWINYGYGLGHSHADCLNIGLYAKNLDMLPDLGYPEYTGQSWPNRFAWNSHSVSHNMLLVNDTACGGSPGGRINLFAVDPPLRVMDVSSKTAYPGLRTYRRTVALVDISDTDSYVFDVFRARGGKNHRLIYNGPAQTATVAGLQLQPQATGTFAGENVKFAEFYDGDVIGYHGSGFMYLYDVERSGKPVDTYLTVDWKGEDLRGRIAEGKEPHLRLHALSPCDEVALASGDPPQNKVGNLRRLRYVIRSRLGENVTSQFVTVLEPYDTAPFVKQVRRLQVEHDADPDSVTAVAVDLADGTTDIIISCEERTSVKVEGGVGFDGQFGMIRVVNDQVKTMRMCNATLLRKGEAELTAPVAAYEGTVTAIDISDPLNNRVMLAPPLPQDDGLIGKVIHFQNDLPLDTSYDIKAITADGISTGDITIIRSFKDNADFAAGYNYLVNPGDRYAVPIVVGRDF